MDYQTLYFILFTTLLIQTAALLQTWRQNPEEPGLRDWGVSGALMTTASLLIVLGLFAAGGSTDANTPFAVLLIRDLGSGVGSAGWVLAWLGIRRFYHRPALNYWLVVAYGAVFTLLLLPGAHLPGWRVFMAGMSIGLFSLLVAWELFREKIERNLVTQNAGLAMCLVALVWTTRGLLAMDDLSRPSGAMLIDRLCIYSSIIMSMVFTLSLILLTNQRVHQRLLAQASIDPLTGALNRRAFFDASRPLLAALRRESASLALCVVDLDHFKKVNDRHGHAIGDQVLARFSALAHANLREGDLFARYGGEEFVILLQRSSLEQAIHTIDRLREACSTQLRDIGDDPLNVTFSAGITYARGPTSISLETLLKAADDSLYQAKDQGRNQTVLCEEDLGEPQEAIPSVLSLEK